MLNQCFLQLIMPHMTTKAMKTKMTKNLWQRQLKTRKELVCSNRLRLWSFSGRSKVNWTVRIKLDRSRWCLFKTNSWSNRGNLKTSCNSLHQIKTLSCPLLTLFYNIRSQFVRHLNIVWSLIQCYMLSPRHLVRNITNNIQLYQFAPVKAGNIWESSPRSLCLGLLL